MIKKILLKIYKIAYTIERIAIKRGIYTECDLYIIRLNYGNKNKGKQEKWKKKN